MKENLPSQIVESIKADAEKKYPGYAVKQLPYKLGRQEQLVKDLAFVEYVSENYVKLHGGFVKRYESQIKPTLYTTLELYSLYINQKK